MKPEILAPAGSVEALKAAIHAGADAVYLGGTRFGARAYADNFDPESMIEAIEYSHLYGVKVYMTVNTLFRNDELVQLPDYLAPYYEAGLDAVIVQDLGVMRELHMNFPEVPIHASTQMTITTGAAFALLKEYGVTRIVPARELSVEEISGLKMGLDVPEVEVFVQGALCYCYSGQCLMSAMLGGRSGNRGRCAQPCRLPYAVYDKRGNRHKTDGMHVLSPKDLCGLESVPELIRAGVDSFKIEGRMKKAEYVAVCVRAYRDVVDAWYEGCDTDHMMERYRRQMAEVFNRGGFTKGYFYQHHGADMMSVQDPGHAGVRIGQTKEIKGNQVSIVLEQEVYQGDLLVLNGEQNEITLTCNVNASAGSVILLNAPRIRELTAKQEVRRMFHSVLMEELGQYAKKENRLPIRGEIVLQTGSPAVLTLSLEQRGRVYQITQMGEMVSKADTRPLSIDVVEDKVGSMGNTRYYFASLEIHLAQDAFCSMKALKELRRHAIQALEEQILEEKRKKWLPPKQLPIADVSEEGKRTLKDCVEAGGRTEGSGGVCVMLSTMEQYEVVKREKQVTELYLDLQYFQKEVIIETIRQEKRLRCYVVLPPVLRPISLRDIQELFLRMKDQNVKADGVVVRNIDELVFLKQVGYQGRVITDYSLYAMNDSAAEVIRTLFPDAGITLPVELNQRQIQALRYGKRDSEIVVYGYQQLMVSAQCPGSTLNQCRQADAEWVLKDRYHKQFFVTGICKYCYSLLYNGIPTLLYDRLSDSIRKNVRQRLHFTRETGEETQNILNCFFRGDVPKVEQTRGHYGRGVE